MDTMLKNTNNSEKEGGYPVHPKKFVLWLLIVSITMLFAAFTSAYIVRRGEGNWNFFELPAAFTYTTIIIVLSSITMQWSYFAAKKDEIGQLKSALFSTLILGIAFCAGQYLGWQEMVNKGLFFATQDKGDISSSYVYVISGIHLFHIIGGIIFIAIMIIQTFRFKVHKKSLLYLNICTTYWHFVGILWVYLFMFLTLTR